MKTIKPIATWKYLVAAENEVMGTDDEAYVEWLRDNDSDVIVAEPSDKVAEYEQCDDYRDYLQELAEEEDEDDEED